MREIKFRAYDKVRKEYLSAGRVLLSINAGQRPKETTQYLDILDLPNRYKDRFEIEQYTGCKDINNTDIYEGDVVCFKTKRVCYYGEIKYDHSMFVVFNNGTCDELEYISNNFGIEVVGNIHQNMNLFR